MIFEVPTINEVIIEKDLRANSGRDNSDDIGWGSCCYAAR